jgi:hypothetical protein
VLVWLLVIALILVLPMWVGYRVTEGKGRGGGLGLLLGFLLGWIGVVICLLLSDRRGAAVAPEQQPSQAARYRECPHCREPMRRDAGTCPHCRSQSPAWTLHEGHWWSQGDDGGWFWLDEPANAWRAAAPAEENAIALSNSQEEGA